MKSCRSLSCQALVCFFSIGPPLHHSYIVEDVVHPYAERPYIPNVHTSHVAHIQISHPVKVPIPPHFPHRHSHYILASFTPSATHTLTASYPSAQPPSHPHQPTTPAFPPR